MGSQKSVHLRDIVIFALCSLFVLTVGYKYFEWKTLNDLISVSNNNLTLELKSNEDSSNFYSNEANPLISELASDNIKTNMDYVNLVDKIRPKVTLTQDMDKNYRKLLEDNKKEIESFKSKSMFLFGSSRKFAKSFVNESIISYDKSLQLTDITIIDNKFINDYFLVSRDMSFANDFGDKLPKSYGPSTVKYVQDNYNQLAVLEKYSKDDFKFQDEEMYKTNNPYGYEVLIKYRDYLKTYYLIMKDLASNDTESATYKSTKLQSQAVSLNVDFEKLFDEKSKEVTEMSQLNLEAIINYTKAYFDFQKNGDKKYPLLGGVKYYNSNLTLCSLYGSKISVYEKIVSSYPSSKDSKSLVSELSKVGPKTEDLDGLFDYDALRVDSNDDISIKYTCFDKDNSKQYSFEIIK
jgi:hypothetical protein